MSLQTYEGLDITLNKKVCRQLFIFRFIKKIVINGERLCVMCLSIFTSDSMKPSKLKRHFKSKPSLICQQGDRIFC